MRINLRRSEATSRVILLIKNYLMNKKSIKKNTKSQKKLDKDFGLW